MEINSVPSTQAAPGQAKPQGSEKEAQTEAVSEGGESKAAPKDSVQISNAAKKMLQEATETAAQTAKEAAGGDAQAKRLLAKEAQEAEAKNPKTEEAVQPQGESKGANFDQSA